MYPALPATRATGGSTMCDRLAEGGDEHSAFREGKKNKDKIVVLWEIRSSVSMYNLKWLRWAVEATENK
jgi:hypothetical protein